MPTLEPPAPGVEAPPTPYYQDDLVTLYHGDCREIAAKRLAQDTLFGGVA